MALASANAGEPENTLYLDLKDGRVVIELRPDLAPVHVARFKELTRQGFYDGLVFHRVIGGFMAQTGDPGGDGTGGTGVNLPAEFSDEPHVRGTVSTARAGRSGQRGLANLHHVGAGSLPGREVHGMGSRGARHGVRG